MSVYMRTRKGKKGKDSIFLAHYRNGKVRYEFLRLYLYSNPKDNIEREHNREVMRLAKQIKAQRELDEQFGDHHAVSPVKEKVGLLQYFEKYMKRKDDYGGWSSTYKHLERFLNGSDLAIGKVDSIWLENFKSYLLTAPIGRGKRKLSRNSALSYYTKLAVLFKQAHLDRYIKVNPCTLVRSIKPEETHKNYVTFEEINSLRKTPCKHEQLKTAFLFACFTGLRFSDLVQITWEQISYSDQTGWQLAFRQQKTGGAETLPIAIEAIELLSPYSRLKLGKIFGDLKYSGYNNQLLKEWFLKAGITKPLTFHSSRHSYATNLLSLNVNISVISKLLGHKNLKTTEVYAKVASSSMREAVNKLGIVNQLN